MNKNQVTEDIIRQATELFLRYGIRSVSMDDIARHLSISKKTIYQFFSDKEEIVLNVTRNYLDLQRAELDEIAADSQNIIENLHRTGLSIRQKMQGLNPNLLFDLEKYHKPSWELYLEFNRGYVFNALRQIMRDGVREGFFRPEINPEILAILRIEQIQLSLNNAIYAHDKYPPAEIQEQLFQHFIHGLLTDKGLKLYTKYHAKVSIHDTLP